MGGTKERLCLAPIFFYSQLEAPISPLFLWRRAAAPMMKSHFRCRKPAKEHSHLCCPKLVVEHTSFTIARR